MFGIREEFLICSENNFIVCFIIYNNAFNIQFKNLMCKLRNLVFLKKVLLTDARYYLPHVCL